MSGRTRVRAARAIALAIVKRRDERPIETTADLAGVVSGVVRREAGARHPATRTFQAIRIFINAELDELERALPQALDALAALVYFQLLDPTAERFTWYQLKRYGLPALYWHGMLKGRA